jgi:uncharacterized cupredoxin-like copper-binding protein
MTARRGGRRAWGARSAALRRLPLALGVAVVVGGAGTAVAAGTSGTGEVPLGPGLVTVEVGVERSRFSTDELTVRAGTVVRFVVGNGDPIAHELVVGDEAVHARHRSGREAQHPPVPGEVSVGPGETGLTVYEFDQVGEVAFACHLPGHLAYGMTGVVRVIP